MLNIGDILQEMSKQKELFYTEDDLITSFKEFVELQSVTEGVEFDYNMEFRLESADMWVDLRLVYANIEYLIEFRYETTITGEGNNIKSGRHLYKFNGSALHKGRYWDTVEKLTALREQYVTDSNSPRILFIYMTNEKNCKNDSKSAVSMHSVKWHDYGSHLIYTVYKPSPSSLEAKEFV